MLTKMEQATATENLVKCGHVVFEIREKIDGQTDRRYTHRHNHHNILNLRYFKQKNIKKLNLRRTAHMCVDIMVHNCSTQYSIQQI